MNIKVDMTRLDPYAQCIRRRYWVLAALLVFVILAALVNVCAGAADLGALNVMGWLSAGPPLSGENAEFGRIVVWKLRLPRIVMALQGGAALGLAGAATQGVLRNPLASPFTLGVASAAGFGAALAITLGFGIGLAGQWTIIGSAFMMTTLACAAVFALSFAKGMGGETVILTGVATMYLFSSLTSLLQYVGDMEQVHSLVFWLLGSLESSTWSKTGISAVVIAIASPLLMIRAWDLNAMTTGDESAESLGVAVKRVRGSCMVLAALLTAAVICVIGTIGFVGLMAPHLCRMVIGSDHRYLFPASFLMGGLTLTAADLVSRTIVPPHVLPIGVVTALLGVPFFFYLLMRKRKDSWT